MRLCRLHFKNLNSLAGEWNVDFESPEFRGGLFAITGPTGAGKSTLLDAVCLALYGRTPRLERVNNSGNEIMTRGERECFAEAVFEIGGKRYSAFWLQKKSARKGAAREWQAPKCRFSRLGHGEEVLADSVSSMAKKVEEVCRLDFERFTRTVMLPQGGFAAFLQADGADRAKLLEELTGAEIYRQISREVYDRTKRERFELEQIRSSQAEHAPLSDEARAAAQRRAAVSKTREKELRAREKELRQALDCSARRDSLAARRAEHERARSELDEERAAFAPQAEKLARAERAAQGGDLYAALTRSRSRRGAAEAELERLEAEASAGAQRREAEERQRAAAAEELALLKKEHGEQAELLAKVHDLDREIESHALRCHEQEARIAELENSFAAGDAQDIAVLAELNQLKFEAEAMGRSLDGAREEKEQAMAAMYRADLSMLSARLEEGTPCPLCGALHHPAPYQRSALQEEELKLHQNAEKAARKTADLERKLASMQEKVSALQMEHKRLSTLGQTAQRSLQDARETLAREQENLESRQRVRRELFGERRPETEAAKLKEALAAAENALTEAEARRHQSALAAARAETELAGVRQDLAELSDEIAAQQAQFDERLKRLGFAEESAWRTAALSEEEIAGLRARSEELQRRKDSLRSQALLLSEEERALGDVPERAAADLKAALEACGSELTELLKNRGADEQTLRHDDECRRRLAELRQAEARQRKIYDLWTRLNDRIGSASGDQFSRYVQGLTFRRLVRAANAQLAQLSDRYRLKAAADDALRLDVVDLWQGGEARTSRNLSGGESFIVSLALALALSHGMKEVKVDSLFLDEGFGTLDEETLETVLDCLNRLRESGKLVGVISHVKTLRERIDARLTLTPGPGGHSALSGPGCSRLG